MLNFDKKSVSSLFINKKEVSILIDKIANKIIFKKHRSTDIPNYLCFNNINDNNSTISLIKNGDPFEINLQYSFDGINWNDYLIGEQILFNDTKKIYIKTKNLTYNFSKSENDYYQFSLTGQENISVTGDIVSLLDPELTTKQLTSPYIFNKLFKDCIQISSTPKLSFTKLSPYCYESMFEGCTSITESPKLNAINLADGCYKTMFKGCTNLNETSELLATKMAIECYSMMFSGCTGLTKIKSIEALFSAEKCFYKMFENCTDLLNIPELMIQSLSPYCYESMFEGCTSITEPPKLNVLSLADGCYKAMFKGCTNLNIDSNILPATILAPYCYESMFEGCTSITDIKLPSGQLITNCYNNMFKSCTQLSSIDVNFIIWDIADTIIGTRVATTNWVENVSTNGIFYCDALLDDIRGISNIPEKWDIVRRNEDCDYIKMLCFTAEEPNAEVTLSSFGNPPEITSLEYTNFVDFNDKDFIPQMTHYNINQTIILENVGDKVYFKVNKLTKAYAKEDNYNTNNDYHTFIINNGKVAASGSIMSLIDPSCYKLTNTFPCSFASLFRNQCTDLTEAPELPATSLATGCYSRMFVACTSLRKAPDLPAINLSEYCYQYMFSSCAFEKTPKMYAVNLNDFSCQIMFKNNKNLIDASNINIHTTGEQCCYDMFNGCISLQYPPKIFANKSSKNCYALMFYNCTSLKYPPSLPATILAYGCYQSMFAYCKSLLVAPDLPCTEIENKDVTYCYSNMFLSCTSLKDGPILPARIVKSPINTDIDYRPYNAICKGCTSLTSITINFSEWSSNVTNDWLTTTNTKTPISNLSNIIDIYNDNLSKIITSNNTGVYLKNSPEKINSVRGVIYSLYSDDLPTAAINRKHSYEPPINWIIKYIPEGLSLNKDTLNFTSKSVTTKISLNKYGNPYNVILQYTTSNIENYENGLIWYDYNIGDEIVLEKDETIYIRSKLKTDNFSKSENDYYQFNINGQTEINGSVMSLIDPKVEEIELKTQYIFINLFKNCKDIITVPKLPATTLSENCYESMFEGCTSIIIAPELPATKLVDGCYKKMFLNCEKLSGICVNFNDWNNGKNTLDWMKNVYLTGIFIKPNNLIQITGDSFIKETWVTSETNDWFYIKNIGLYDSRINFDVNDLSNDIYNSNYDNFYKNLQYSYNKIYWNNSYIYDEVEHKNIYKSIHTIKPGEIIYFRNTSKFNNSEINNLNSSFIKTLNKIKIESQVYSLEEYNNRNRMIIKIGGNILSLVSDEIDNKKYAYYLDNLFSTTQLISENVSNFYTNIDINDLKIPGNIRGYEMFANQAKLINVPKFIDNELLVHGCYERMFYNSGIKQLPELPATILTNECYKSMFQLCYNLKNVTLFLPAEKLTEFCYEKMFYACENIEILNLTYNAKEYGLGSFKQMFMYCYKLTYGPYSNSIFKNENTDGFEMIKLTDQCYYEMFANCSSMIWSPDMPGIEITNTEYSFYRTFYNCNKLEHVTTYFTDIPNNKNSLEQWLLSERPTPIDWYCPQELIDQSDSLQQIYPKDYIFWNMKPLG